MIEIVSSIMYVVAICCCAWLWNQHEERMYEIDRIQKDRAATEEADRIYRETVALIDDSRGHRRLPLTEEDTPPVFAPPFDRVEEKP